MGAIFWAIATAVFAVMEVIIPSLVTIWLALAALIVTGVSLIIKNPFLEFLIFSVLSLVFVLFTRPFAQAYLSRHKSDEDFDAKMIGTEIKIEKAIDLSKEKKEYEVKFKGSIWSAISDERFNENDIVKIKDFVGNKIILERK